MGRASPNPISEFTRYGRRSGVPVPACGSTHGRRRQLQWCDGHPCESADWQRHGARRPAPSWQSVGRLMTGAVAPSRKNSLGYDHGRLRGGVHWLMASDHSAGPSAGTDQSPPAWPAPIAPGPPLGCARNRRHRPSPATRPAAVSPSIIESSGFRAKSSTTSADANSGPTSLWERTLNTYPCENGG